MEKRKFDRQFKVDAVKQFHEQGGPIRVYAQKIGVHENNFARWVTEYERWGDLAFPGQGSHNRTRAQNAVAGASGATQRRRKHPGWGEKARAAALRARRHKALRRAGVANAHPAHTETRSAIPESLRAQRNGSPAPISTEIERLQQKVKEQAELIAALAPLAERYIVGTLSHER